MSNRYGLDLGRVRECLEPLRDVPQSPVHHPEGNVYRHSMLVGSWMELEILHREQASTQAAGPRVLLVAAYLHDLGKLSCTQVHEDGRITSHGHAEAGAELALGICPALGLSEAEGRQVYRLIKEHMNAENLGSARAVRQLCKRLRADGVLPQAWYWLVEADLSGRAPLPPRKVPLQTRVDVFLTYHGLAAQEQEQR